MFVLLLAFVIIFIMFTGNTKKEYYRDPIYLTPNNMNKWYNNVQDYINPPFIIPEHSFERDEKQKYVTLRPNKDVNCAYWDTLGVLSGYPYYTNVLSY